MVEEIDFSLTRNELLAVNSDSTGFDLEKSLLSTRCEEKGEMRYCPMIVIWFSTQ